MAADFELPRRAIESYSRSLDAVAQDAVADLAGFLSGYDLDGMDLEARKALRDDTIEKVVEIVGDYGDASAATGAEFFDALLDELGGDGYAAMPPAIDRRRVDKAVRRCAADLFGEDADLGRFSDGVSEFVARTVSHRADDCVAESAVGANEARRRRGGKGRMRFARVPSGPSCGFCIMLASRGFVYATRQSAGELTRFHNRCDCRIVEGYPGMRVEGYDPDALYERYKSCRESIRADARPSPIKRDWDRLPASEKAKHYDPRDPKKKPSYDQYLQRRITEEMDTRDRRWLYDGTEPEPILGKPWEALSGDERQAVLKLKANGFAVKTIKEDGAAAANIDFEIGGDPWEAKNVTNGRGSVSNQMSRSRKKFYAIGGQSRTVITTERCSSSTADVISGIELRLRDGEEVLLVTGESDPREAHVIRIRK